MNERKEKIPISCADGGYKNLAEFAHDVYLSDLREREPSAKFKKWYIKQYQLDRSG